MCQKEKEKMTFLVKKKIKMASRHLTNTSPHVQIKKSVGIFES
jgi:hypothetical protein